MEKKVMNTRLAVVLLFGLLLAGQDAAEAAADPYAPATEAAPTTEAASATATATDATEATPATTPGDGKASYGKGPSHCEVPGTCEMKFAKSEEATPAPTEAATGAAEATPTTPGDDGGKASYGSNVKLASSEEANPYTRGCSKVLGCRG